MMPQEKKITADGVPHSQLKQQVCPWCGMDMRCGSGWHVQGFRETGLCGSKWFPDFEGGHIEGREQHTACKEIARLRADASTASPACDRCQSAHCCSVRTHDGETPLCVTDPDGSLPLWMPWTNADVQARVNPLHAEIDRLRAEAGRVVVPERAAWLTIDEMSDVVLEKCGIPKDYANEIAKAIADASIAKGAHSVPSSRILKDGEVAVDAEEWEAMCDLGFDPEPCRLDHNGCCQEHNWFSEKPCPTAILQRLYVLRTQATKGAGDDS